MKSDNLAFLTGARLLLLLLSLCSIAACDGKDSYHKSFINPYPRYKEFNDGGDPGEPLFLTPLINKAEMSMAEIRSKSKVEGSQFHGVNSYSGYLTVNSKYNSNMFFWYFPSEDSEAYAPVVLWLQGGPGASSLFGLFNENGPFEIHNQTLQKRNVSWSLTHNLIFIDNPVGSGFSFTDNDDGFAKNEKTVGRDLHEAMTQLYELFEWNTNAGFWITGESYAGKYVPALAFHIHNAQNLVNTRVLIPLKGIVIGNGWSDPMHQLKYGDYLYQLGLIDDLGLNQFHDAESKAVSCIKQHDMVCAFETFQKLFIGNVTNQAIFRNLTGYDFYYNYLKTKEDSVDKVMGEYVQSTITRRAIHVGNKTFYDASIENKVELYLKNDTMDTVAPWIAELLSHYTVCIYNGQLDIIVAYPLTRNYLLNLKFVDSDYYKIAPRKIWYVDDEIAGYVKHAGNLIEIMVRNAGTMAATDQPKWIYNLIYGLTHFNKI